MSTTQHPKLNRYLNKVRKHYDIDSFVAREIGSEQIIDYYTQSSPGYAFFHSVSGSVHMSLSKDGTFNRDGYYEQARLVEDRIERTNSRNVLELASGKGFNTIYLAEHHPEIQFTGVDITPAHVHIAQKKAQSAKLQNVHFEQGDFHDLRFPDQSFDYLFEVESICHAANMEQVLRAIYRVLKPGGTFTLFDGFRKRHLDTVTPDERTAAILVEKAMAVGGA